jgi:hypothetical protein
MYCFVFIFRNAIDRFKHKRKVLIILAFPVNIVVEVVLLDFVGSFQLNA